MKKSFGDDAMGPEYEQQVRDSIDRHKGKNIEAMILNSADSLDIGRVATGAFEIDKFMFLKTGNGEKPNREIEALRQELAKEADLLQRLTNPLCARRRALDLLDMQNANARGAEEKFLNEQKEGLLNDIAADFAADWEVSSDDYMKRFEDTIKNNPQMFPVLSKYYSGNARPA